MDEPSGHSSVQIGGAGCPLLALPGELRNQIYNYTLGESIVRMGRGRKWKEPQRPFSLAHVCRSVRSEFLPLYNAQTNISLLPHDLYAYIDSFLAPPDGSMAKIAGFIILDLDRDPACINIKPLLQLLRRAKGLHVGTMDIIAIDTPKLFSHIYVPSIQDILADIYDIRDMDLFQDYVETAMSAVELDCDDAKGVEIIFELRPEYWESWMGEWSKPDHDPNYRIPIELEGNVVQWGMQCGMELNRSTGSHLTVNFRHGEADV